MNKRLLALLSASFLFSPSIFASELADNIEKDYDEYLADLWDHFHRNPELSTVEFQTADRMAKELRAAGFDVTEKVGGTGVVAILKNGNGPLVMMRADMDGLPVEEKSGLSNASKARQEDPITGNVVPVMHACGHDVHITSLVAEERVLGARAMRADNLWERFGVPDYALAFHVGAGSPAGTIEAPEGPTYAGADTVDIIVHGIGAHGAAPHRGKDPILIASQIVVALQTLVSRELAPHSPGVVTVGSFHSGTKHNIISDRAHLQLTVRNTNEETRKTLLEGIERIAVNAGRMAGLPEDKLPEVIVSEESVPPTLNDAALARRLKMAWSEAMGDEALFEQPPEGMGAEDFPMFTVDPDIKSVYWSIGGTPQEELDAEDAGGPRVASHHSPLFKISPEPSVRAGVESTVVALLELMGD